MLRAGALSSYSFGGGIIEAVAKGGGGIEREAGCGARREEGRSRSAICGFAAGGGGTGVGSATGGSPVSSKSSSPEGRLVAGCWKGLFCAYLRCPRARWIIDSVEGVELRRCGRI